MQRLRKIVLRILAVAAALVLLYLYSCVHQKQLIAAEVKEEIGFDLMLQLRSKFVVGSLPTGTVDQLNSVMLRAPHIKVLPKDAPPPDGNSTADYRIIYYLRDIQTQAETPLLGLRMKVQNITNHTVLGFWVPHP